MSNAEGVKVFEANFGDTKLRILRSQPSSVGDHLSTLTFQVDGYRVPPDEFKLLLAAFRTSSLEAIEEWLNPDSDHGICTELHGIKDALTHFPTEGGERGVADIIHAYVADS